MYYVGELSELQPKLDDLRRSYDIIVLDQKKL